MSRIYKSFRKQESSIGRIIKKYVSNPSDINELTQETFVRAYASELRQEILEPERFLFRTARNLAINKIKRKENDLTESGQDMDELAVIVDECQSPPEERVDACQRLAILAEALEMMPPEVRETMIMRRIEGLTVPKIARRLDMSVSGVERRLAKAMVVINSHIRESGLDPADFGAKRVARSSKNTAKRRQNRHGRDDHD